jgi:hypothetical protein
MPQAAAAAFLRRAAGIRDQPTFTTGKERDSETGPICFGVPYELRAKALVHARQSRHYASPAPHLRPIIPLSDGCGTCGSVSFSVVYRSTLRTANEGYSRRAPHSPSRGCIPGWGRRPVPGDIGLFGPEHINRVRAEITSPLEATCCDVKPHEYQEASLRRWGCSSRRLRGGFLRPSSP